MSMAAAFLAQTTSAVSVDCTNNDIELDAIQFSQIEKAAPIILDEDLPIEPIRPDNCED